MAQKKHVNISREEQATGKPSIEETLDKNSREYHAKHGWPKKKKAKTETKSKGEK